MSSFWPGLPVRLIALRVLTERSVRFTGLSIIPNSLVNEHFFA